MDTQTEPGRTAVCAFLEDLDKVARAARAEKTSRAYRSKFTVNYRALFPDEARNYRVDVLEASVKQNDVIWVNGAKFEFSAEAMQRADALQLAWQTLGTLLRRWSRAPEETRTFARPALVEASTALVALDFAWASFEHQYISELIEIEEQARKLIVQAIEHDKRLRNLEVEENKKPRTSPTDNEARLALCRDEQISLVSCIAHLNSVANTRRKGRDDLGLDVLLDAMAALKRCDVAERSGEGTEAVSAARILATDVVDSFAAMRSYFQDVTNCLERVDPHLCNNAGLVERLVDWEESWELGNRYVRNEKLLDALCDLVGEIRKAQRLAPALAKMCEDCDVELFMILPRIVWLRFLAKPTQQMEMMRSLLPKRFSDSKAGENAPWDSELQDRLGKFQNVEEYLSRNQPQPISWSADSVAWRVLLMRVIHGSPEAAAAAAQHEHSSLALGPQAQAVVEDLVHELEGWSMELQRHCPEDWNQCSAILVQCLTGESSPKAKAPFKV